MIRPGGSKQRWLIWVVILAMTITACAVPVEGTVATPQANAAQSSAEPDACQFRDGSVVDYAEGAGQPTPALARALWPPDERPSGEPAIIRKKKLP